MDKKTATQHGNGQHAHMLGCGRAWFSQRYPDEWDRIKSLPAEAALEGMLAYMQARA